MNAAEPRRGADDLRTSSDGGKGRDPQEASGHHRSDCHHRRRLIARAQGMETLSNHSIACKRLLIWSHSLCIFDHLAATSIVCHISCTQHVMHVGESPLCVAVAVQSAWIPADACMIVIDMLYCPFCLVVATDASRRIGIQAQSISEVGSASAVPTHYYSLH